MTDFATAGMTDNELVPLLEATTKDAFRGWDDDPKPYNRLMTDLAHSQDSRVRAWVAGQDEVPFKIMKALLFDDPDGSVREAAGSNYNCGTKLMSYVRDRFDALLKDTARQDREGVLREHADSYIALERDRVVAQPDCPADIRERLALHDPCEEVRGTAVAATTDTAMLTRVLEHEQEKGEEHYWEVDYVLGMMVRNEALPQDFLRDLYKEWGIEGGALGALASNENCPSDVLDSMASLEPNEFHREYAYSFAMRCIASNPNVRQCTIDKLLQLDDPEIVAAVRLELQERETYNLGAPLP